jgi:hypothetical protein
MNSSEGDSVTIAGKLVRFLRNGVKRELSASVAILATQVGDNTLDTSDISIDPEVYYCALARFDGARTLLDAIGLSDQPEPPDVELDLERWPRLVLKALETELDTHLIRLEDAHNDGIDLPRRDVPDLECLVVDIRAKIGASPSREHEQSSPQKQLARRPTRRSRGDY